MLVWQSSEAQRACDREKTGGESRVHPYRRAENVIPWRSSWQISREMRLAVEYALAIGCALASSWLLLRLGL